MASTGRTAAGVLNDNDEGIAIVKFPLSTAIVKKVIAIVIVNPGTVICKNCKIRKKESINERKRHRKKFRWRFCFNEHAPIGYPTN